MGGLYHYTSNEGAIGIINSGCLFATHYRYLNDFSELSHARNIILPIFEKEFEVAGRKLIKNGLLKKSLIKDHGKYVFRGEAIRLYDISIKTTNDLTPVFITSFCRHEIGSDQEKDGLLSQWRGYGSAGGCALEFEQDELGKKILAERDSYAYTSFFVADVRYKDHEKILDAALLQGVADAVLRSMARDPTLKKERLDELLHNLYRAIAIISPQMKSHAFREEGEVRIIAPLMRPPAAAEYPKRRQRPIYMRYRDGSPIPYVKLFEEEDGSLPIKRVIVGPQRNQAKVAYAIELALEARGSKAEVATSSISYLP